MAFPVVETTSTSNQNVQSATTQTVTMPSGVVSGDLLVVGILLAQFDMDTAPAGWTLLKREFHQTVVLFLYHKVSDGTEGASEDWTTTGGSRSAHVAYRISGAGTPQFGGLAESGTASTSPDPASFTPTGGAQDYLWLAVCGCENSPVLSQPTNYTNPLVETSGTGTFHADIGTAQRNLNAASEDPGAFTITNSVHWVAGVVAVPPAGTGLNAPTDVVASNPTTTTIDLDWTDTNSGTAFPRLYRRTPAGSGGFTFVEQLASATATSYTFTGLNPGTEYDVGVSYTDS